MHALRKQHAASGRAFGGESRLSACPSHRACSYSTKQRHVQCSISRRDGLASIALAPVLLSAGEAAAEPVAGQAVQYVDQTDAFKLSVPADWQQYEGMIDGNTSFQGSSGARRTIAWYPTDGRADETNVSLTITNTSAEFTGLGSFGNVFAFGTNLVNSMDRSFLLRVQAAGPKRHLYTMVALSYNGRYNRLYTLTAQCLESQVAETEPMLKQVLKSFQPPERVA
ncbi:hypothetical protein COO60DRAFT_1700062 [Scenedesmus sp. NREL 46B-D3]|nr:hypothetical protein COO60DRAFT_1700062 [Scenedesmus sp. NREL 46B-D3]